MSFAVLLAKLLQIETVAATGDLGAIHALVIEAEDMVLKLERDLIDELDRRRDFRKAA